MTSELRPCCDKPDIIFLLSGNDCFYSCRNCEHRSPESRHGLHNIVELEEQGIFDEVIKKQALPKAIDLWNRSLEQEG